MAEGFVSIRTRSDPAGVALQSALPHTHAPTPRGESRWTFQKFWPSPTMQTCTLAHTADATTAAIRNEIWSTPKKLRRVESLLGSRSSLIGGGRFNFHGDAPQTPADKRSLDNISIRRSNRFQWKMAAAGQNKKKSSASKFRMRVPGAGKRCVSRCSRRWFRSSWRPRAHCFTLNQSTGLVFRAGTPTDDAGRSSDRADVTSREAGHRLTRNRPPVADL